MEGKQAMKQLTQPQNPGADLRGRELSSECGSSAGSLGLQHGIAKLLLWRNSHRHHEDKHAGNPPPPVPLHPSCSLGVSALPSSLPPHPFPPVVLKGNPGRNITLPINIYK